MKECNPDFDFVSYVQLGNKRTFAETTMLFFLVGAGFGTSFSMTRINILDWNKTSFTKKIFRMIITAGVYFGISFLFSYFVDAHNSEASETFFY